MPTWKHRLRDSVSWLVPHSAESPAPEATKTAGCKQPVRQQDEWKRDREYSTAVWTLSKQHIYRCFAFFCGGNSPLEMVKELIQE